MAFRRLPNAAKYDLLREVLQKYYMPMENKNTSSSTSAATSAPASKQTSAGPSAATKSAFSATPAGSPMKSFDTKPQEGPSAVKVLAVLLLMAALGIGTGYGIASYTADSGKSVVPKALDPNAPEKGKSYGVDDVSNFKDTAEGTLKEGGIEGEGQFHLERPGGESQNVYLTSSAVDLSQFVGQKIKVWGQTQAAQKAGWLMDVGKVEVK